MKLRRGFYKVVLRRIKKGDLFWLFRQGVNLCKAKNDYKKNTGKISTGPIIAHIFSTNRCNLKCRMCDIPEQRSETELTTAECKEILGQLKQLGTSAVSFTGGEPLLREDIFELIDYAKGCRLDTILVTNGLLLDRHLQRLLKAEPAIVNISLDSSSADVHDRIRGMSGAFKKTTTNIHELAKRLKEKKLSTDLVISTVLSEDNINNLDRHLNFCHQLGASRIILCPEHDFDRSRANSTLKRIGTNCNISDFLLNHKLRPFIDNSDYYLSRLNSVLDGENPPLGCPAGYTTIFVDWEANVYPCKAYLEMGWPIFNLRKEKLSLKEIWYSSAYDKVRREAKICQKCFLTVNREFDSLFR